jgi:hypothetical protein
MGFLGALAGYIGGKTTVAVMALSLYAGAITTTALSPVCPALIPVTTVLWTAADACGAMAISPIDPITAAVTTTVAAGTGPV